MLIFFDYLVGSHPFPDQSALLANYIYCPFLQELFDLDIHCFRCRLGHLLPLPVYKGLRHYYLMNRYLWRLDKCCEEDLWVHRVMIAETMGGHDQSRQQLILLLFIGKLVTTLLH